MPETQQECIRYLDDYLSLTGRDGSIESAIRVAGERAIAPLARQALERLEPPHLTRWIPIAA